MTPPNELLQRAKGQNEYWEAKLIFSFLTQFHDFLNQSGVDLETLSTRTGLSPRRIQAILRGDAKLTIATTVNLARACQFEISLVLTPVRSG